MSHPLPVPVKHELSSLRGFASLLGRWLARLCFLFFVLAVLGPFLVVNVFEVLGVALFGWAAFLRRVLPMVSLNADLIGMAVVCILLLAGGGHCFMRWVTVQVAKARNVEAETRLWPWKWTWCGCASLGLTFVTGSSLVGIVHQAGWIMANREPWFDDRGRAAYHEWHALERGCERVFLEPAGGVGVVRERLSRSDERYPWNWQVIRQKYHVLSVLGDDGTVSSIFFFSRDAKFRAGFGAKRVGIDESEHVLVEKIDEWLRRNHSRLLAL